jgi:hypothetical protein
MELYDRVSLEEKDGETVMCVQTDEGFLYRHRRVRYFGFGDGPMRRVVTKAYNLEFRHYSINYRTGRFSSWDACVEAKWKFVSAMVGSQAADVKIAADVVSVGDGNVYIEIEDVVFPNREIVWRHKIYL